MITPVDLKGITSNLVPVLKEITENGCFTDFTFLEAPPDAACQYWEYALEFLGDPLSSISYTCGYFTGPGQLRNSQLSIHQFFKNDDAIMEEFALLIDHGVFEPVLTHLQRAAEISGLDYGVMISLEGRTQGGDEWRQGICEETILILHEHEKTRDRVDIGCQQSERYRIKITEGEKITFLNVPFDKVNRFKGAERVEGYREAPYFRYEVALSFAGEDRPYVSNVANELRRRKVRVFYDDYERVSLWGKDLYSHLDDVYRKKARFCVLFLSESYRDTVWTNHERESAQARAFEERQEYVLPVRLDETEIPGIRPTLGYIDGRSIASEALADLIQKKLLEID